MRMITKCAEPRSLTQHRAKAHSDYDNYERKDDLRLALVSEQKGLCCYCSGRIREVSTAMKIEHWQCQANYRPQQLSYGNLLGVCLGGEGQPPDEQHCDTRKSNLDLKWNPANIAHMIESRVYFTSDGYIRSPDPDFNRQLDEVLNLNIAILRNNRKSILEVVAKWWKTTPNARQKVQQQIERRVNSAEHSQFSPVAVSYLRQKLGGAPA